jgi:serine/threonine-protein kinase
VIGTAQYLSPEQARGEQVDARSDIYSTGCLLYELLTGRPPFVGDSALSVAYQHVREAPTPPSALDPEISPEIDAITLKALAKSLDDRYQSAIEMRTDVERALNGVDVLAPAVVGAELATEPFLASPLDETSATMVNPALVAAEEEPERRRTGWWVGALLALAALVIAGLILVPQLVASGPPAQVRVPSVKGLTVNAAQQKLTSAGLQLGKQTPKYSSSVKAGQILRQSEDPHTLVDRGTAIDVVVSTGTNTVIIPADISGMTLQQATRRLQALHLRVKPQPDRQSTERRDQVTTTVPGPGVEVPIRSKVTVRYSAGYMIVPLVVGKHQQAAEAALRARGLVPVVSDTVSSAPAGTVTRQSLQAGTHAQRGTAVVIAVSLGPPPTTPTPTSTAPTTTAPTTTAPTTSSPPTTSAPTTAPSSSPSTTTPTTTH